MGDTQGPVPGCLARRTDRPARQRDSGPPVVTYSLASGALATISGAAVSLVGVRGTSRIAAWCAVSVIVSVLAGLVYESAVVGACWSASRRWLSRLARL